jgi:hypothetical protein
MEIKRNASKDRYPTASDVLNAAPTVGRALKRKLSKSSKNKDWEAIEVSATGGGPGFPPMKAILTPRDITEEYGYYSYDFNAPGASKEESKVSKQDDRKQKHPADKGGRAAALTPAVPTHAPRNAHPRFLQKPKNAYTVSSFDGWKAELLPDPEAAVLRGLLGYGMDEIGARAATAFVMMMSELDAVSGCVISGSEFNASDNDHQLDSLWHAIGTALAKAGFSADSNAGYDLWDGIVGALSDVKRDHPEFDTVFKVVSNRDMRSPALIFSPLAVMVKYARGHYSRAEAMRAFDEMIGPRSKDLTTINVHKVLAKDAKDKYDQSDPRVPAFLLVPGHKATKHFDMGGWRDALEQAVKQLGPAPKQGFGALLSKTVTPKLSGFEVNALSTMIDRLSREPGQSVAEDDLSFARVLLGKEELEDGDLPKAKLIGDCSKRGLMMFVCLEDEPGKPTMWSPWATAFAVARGEIPFDEAMETLWFRLSVEASPDEPIAAAYKLLFAEKDDARDGGSNTVKVNDDLSVTLDTELTRQRAREEVLKQLKKCGVIGPKALKIVDLAQMFVMMVVRYKTVPDDQFKLKQDLADMWAKTYAVSNAVASKELDEVIQTVPSRIAPRDKKTGTLTFTVEFLKLVSDSMVFKDGEKPGKGYLPGLAVRATSAVSPVAAVPSAGQWDMVEKALADITQSDALIQLSLDNATDTIKEVMKSISQRYGKGLSPEPIINAASLFVGVATIMDKAPETSQKRAVMAWMSAVENGGGSGKEFVREIMRAFPGLITGKKLPDGKMDLTLDAGILSRAVNLVKPITAKAVPTEHAEKSTLPETYGNTDWDRMLGDYLVSRFPSIPVERAIGTGIILSLIVSSMLVKGYRVEKAIEMVRMFYDGKVHRSTRLSQKDSLIISKEGHAIFQSSMDHLRKAGIVRYEKGRTVIDDECFAVAKWIEETAQGKATAPPECMTDIYAAYAKEEDKDPAPEPERSEKIIDFPTFPPEVETDRHRVVNTKTAQLVRAATLLGLDIGPGQVSYTPAYKKLVRAFGSVPAIGDDKIGFEEFCRATLKKAGDTGELDLILKGDEDVTIDRDHPEERFGEGNVTVEPMAGIRIFTDAGERVGAGRGFVEFAKGLGVDVGDMYEMLDEVPFVEYKGHVFLRWKFSFEEYRKAKEAGGVPAETRGKKTDHIRPRNRIVKVLLAFVRSKGGSWKGNRKQLMAEMRRLSGRVLPAGTALPSDGALSAALEKDMEYVERKYDVSFKLTADGEMEAGEATPSGEAAIPEAASAAAPAVPEPAVVTGWRPPAHQVGDRVRAFGSAGPGVLSDLKTDVPEAVVEEWFNVRSASDPLYVYKLRIRMDMHVSEGGDLGVVPVGSWDRWAIAEEWQLAART